MKVTECMCPDVCFVKPDCNVYNVAKIMNENHIGCIPVCNDNKYIVGLVTDRDIVLRSVACNKDAKTTSISDIMTTNVYTCYYDDDVNTVQNLMSKNQIRRIPVIDSNKKMVGILSTGDLVRYADKIDKEQINHTLEKIYNCSGNNKNCY